MTPPEADVTELPSSPGARLRREREARGLTEQQAAETLTLDPSVVFALEANDFAVLGAPVFAKGHLRRYAALLGVPDEEILGAYERSKQHMPEPSLVPKSRLEMMPERSRPKWPWVLGGLAIFLVAALAVAYISANGLPFMKGSDEEPAMRKDAAAEPAANAATPESAQTHATDSASAAATPTSTWSTTQSTTEPARQGDAAGAGPTDEKATPANGASVVTSNNAASGTPAITPAAAPAITPGQVQLQLTFRGDSWVEVFDGSGRAVLYDLGKGGTERTLVAVAPLSVTIGNAASVGVAINGKAVTAPRQSGQVMARFSVAASGAMR